MPIDKSKGSDAAAEKYLKSLEEEDTEEDTDSEDTDEGAVIDELSRKLTKENIEEYAILEESTVQTLTPDKDGYISWSWELEDGSAGDGPLFVGDTYENGKLYVTGGFTEYNSNNEKRILLSTIVCNEDGTVTAAVYRMK